MLYVVQTITLQKTARASVSRYHQQLASQSADRTPHNKVKGYSSKRNYSFATISFVFCANSLKKKKPREVC